MESLSECFALTPPLPNYRPHVASLHQVMPAPEGRTLDSTVSSPSRRLRTISTMLGFGTRSQRVEAKPEGADTGSASGTVIDSPRSRRHRVSTIIGFKTRRTIPEAKPESTVTDAGSTTTSGFAALSPRSRRHRVSIIMGFGPHRTNTVGISGPGSGPSYGTEPRPGSAGGGGQVLAASLRGGSTTPAPSSVVLRPAAPGRSRKRSSIHYRVGNLAVA